MVDWAPFAVRRYGPAWKMGRYDFLPNLTAPKIGEVKHSAVGPMAGIWSRLDGPDQVSFHFAIAYDGTVFQSYPANAICWHAGSARWNIDTVGIEHEGGLPGFEGEPLRQAQVDATVRLTAWLAEQFGRPDVGRYPEPAQWWLLEHRQVYATACPSGRIPWPAILAELKRPALVVPTVAEVEHASPWLAASFYKQDRSLLHAYDAGVIERAIQWWRAG